MCKSLLDHAWVYTLFVDFLGARKGRRIFADRHIRAREGMRMLDIGCGPAEILDFLPSLDYYGFDMSERYIASARRKFGHRGRFEVAPVDQALVDRFEGFDLVLASAILHHLDDEHARALLEIARSALKPGGRLVTLDPCFVKGQHPFARFLIEHDRGQHVRDEAGYLGLARAVFPNVESFIYHDLHRFPYTHVVLEAS